MLTSHSCGQATTRCLRRSWFMACHTRAALGRRKAWKQALLFCEHSRYAYPLPIQSPFTGRHKLSINSHSAREALCIAAAGVTAIKRMIGCFVM